MAIMVTPKLANLPDVTTTTPSDGQVLTYDDGTGQWVNEDAASGGVTDHGALTGLADDDHSQYILVAGTRAFTGSPSAPGAGSRSERFGVGATAAATDAIAYGYGATASTTNSVAIGSFASVTTGASSIAIGRNATTTGATNIIVGVNLASTHDNVMALAAGGTINGARCVMIGVSTVAASDAVAIGPYASANHAAAMAFGRNATTTKTNQMVVGATSYGVNEFLQIGSVSATNSVTQMRVLDLRTTGTPAAGFGAGILFQLETTTTESQDAARISAVWSDATHATRTGDIVFSTVSGGAALSEKLRLTGAGILKFSGTMGNSTKVPGTDAPADWVQIDIGGTTYYLPAYAA